MNKEYKKYRIVILRLRLSIGSEVADKVSMQEIKPVLFLFSKNFILV